ncbi:transcription termination/antitermination protein NusG [Bradyrhizobium diazoefficiens]|uniref:transcription termination/antitermination protein NusG n=1 Tax=Bradyrhizobium diazoefficiens TaxID=1355477 RepID=UPI00383461CB
MQYIKGQIVAYVPVSLDAISVPVHPERWYPLCVTPGRDGKVIKAFEERGFSGWSPMVISFVNRATGDAARRPHLGKRVVKPFLPGLILLPDFELVNLGRIRSLPDVDNLLNTGGLRSWLNRAEIAVLRDIVAAESLAPSQRKRAQLKISQRVQIAAGLFVGFNALIEAIDSKGRLKLYVEDGRRGVTVSGLTETQVEVI